MTDESMLAMRANKCANIIIAISDLHGISMQDAADMFYKSATAQLIEEGVADLQCRSDKYLATLIWEEQSEQK